jgi:DNA-directed RNA polymerase beta subunit
VFPISDARELFALEFVAYEIGEPKYTMDECVERDLTFSAPLKARLRLNTREEVDGVKRDKDVIEQEVYLGELPLITDSGTFIINGAERVIVSQLHRSPGVFFDEMTHPNGKQLYNARIIPYRGSWVEFSLDVNDIMHVHIDRKRKLPVTVLLRALGFVNDREILELFYEKETLDVEGQEGRGVLGRICALDLMDEARARSCSRRMRRSPPRRSRCLKKSGSTRSRCSSIPAPGRRRPRAQHAAQGPDRSRRRKRSTASTTCSVRASRRGPIRRARS